VAVRVAMAVYSMLPRMPAIVSQRNWKKVLGAAERNWAVTRQQRSREHLARRRSLEPREAENHVPLALPKTADCSDTSTKGSECAAAKIAYHQAARRAMPALLQMVKGEKTDSGYGQDLIELFHGFGEDEDQEATITLELKLRRCGYSVEPLRARKAIQDARQSDF